MAKTDKENFFQQVYKVVRQVPKGRVTTYGHVARYLGSKAPRMVGWAMNSSFSSEHPVPAHRVVNREGILTGKHHFGDIYAMQQLLEEEDIEVKDDKVQNFKELLWDPTEELT